MGFCFRPACANDVAQLAAIDRQSPGGGWNEAELAQELALSWSHVDVLEEGEGGGLLGFVVYWVVADEVQLLNLAVHPASRRRGVGTMLVQHVQAAAGDGYVSLEVRKSNTAARGLYERRGFRYVGERPGYYRVGNEDALLLRWSRDDRGGDSS